MGDLTSKAYMFQMLGVFNDREHGDEHFLNGIETAREIVENAPIVDAIPVEWLEARIKYAKETGIREAQEAFEFVLMCWKGVE